MTEKASILFVDDEERIVRSLKMLFRTTYDVHTTTDGKQAVEILKKESIHAIISDQRMPLMTGVEVLRSAREVSPNTMRLLLTGYSDLASIVGSVNEGEIFRYINKPWENQELKSTIDMAAKIGLNLARLNPQRPAVSPTPNNKILAPKTIATSPALLVIDDDNLTFDTIKDLITHYPVFWAKTLTQAFDVLVAHPEIGILVSEVRVNDEDITESLKALKLHYPHILTLVLTSFQDTKLLIELINQGQIYRFLPKPILKGLLEKSLQAAINHYQLLEEKPQLTSIHTVETPKTNNVFPISEKIMGFIKRMRIRP